MATIQIILLISILFIIGRVILQYHKKKIDARLFIGWLVLWVSGAFIVIVPDSVNSIADIVGVSRGADVVIYISLILIFFLFFKIYQRIISLEKDIVKIVRALSLKDTDYDETEKT